MSTGDKLVNFFVDRLLSRTDLDTYFAEYLKNLTVDSFSALLQGRSGTLDADVIGLLADGIDQFQLDATLADSVVVGGGEILTVTAGVVGESRNLYYENTIGVTYNTGLKYGQISADVDTNPRKGNPEYRTLQDVIGEVDNPTSLTDTFGVNLKVVIDSVTEVGVSNVLRKARIYLVTPASADPAKAFFDADVQWDGANNYVDIPYAGAAGPLGQDTSTSPPSTTITDYKVWLKGPTVKRNTDLSLDSDYAFLGTILGTGLGNPPVVLDTSNQFAVFLITLDAAYDGIGAGAGNVIEVDTVSRPVELRGFTGVSAIRPDLHAMFLNKDFDGNEWRKMQSFGREQDLPRFFDGFNYNDAIWVSDATIPAHLYIATAVGAGSLTRAKPAGANPDLGASSSGVAEMVCDGAGGSSIKIEGPLLRVQDRLPAFYCRMAPEVLSDQDIYVGLKHAAGVNPGFGFYIDEADIKGYVQIPAGAITSTAALYTSVGDDLVDCYAVSYADVGSATNYSVAFWITGMGVPTVLDAPVDFAAMLANGWDWSLNATVVPKVGGVHADLTLWLDAWEGWTRLDTIGA